ncbi:MAG: glycosyltransferase family 4 protein [Dyella sp.]
MPLALLSVVLTLLAGASLLSLLVVRLAIAYAHRRGMFDQPGQRRSHQVATARGGGIGIVLALVVTQPLAAYWLASEQCNSVLALTGATILVALVGWWDDHRSLPVLPRLGAQLVACGGFAAVLLYNDGLSGWWWWLLLLAGGWSVNLHNFMDGIDGLLVQQSIFVATGLAVLSWWAGQPGLLVICLLLATAGWGFGYYNWPPARIFMGDVGSGALGLQIFALVALLWGQDPLLLWPGLMLCSVFVVDASLTLLTRMLRGKRWLAPHREHLYQWLVRGGATHAKVDRIYLCWNLALVAPLVWLAVIWPTLGLAICFGLYLLTAGTWLVIKRRCLRRDAYGLRHVST